MKTRLLTFLVAAGVALVAALTALTMPALAELQKVWVRLPTGEVVQITVDVPPGSTIEDMQLPGEIVPPPDSPQETIETAPAPAPTETTPTTPEEPAPKTETEPKPAPKAQEPKSPKSGDRSQEERTNSGVRVERKKEKTRRAKPQAKPEEPGDAGDRSPKRRPKQRSRLRKPDGTPTPTNPGFVDALPGPSSAAGVPNFIIRKFRVPPFLLSIYQAAGIEYGIRWEVLAAINEIETDYGRNLNVSSAGAVGWMQFMPATWRTYGTDGNKDGREDPYNPVDAIFAAARYLAAAGYAEDVRGALFAYNHADWYVDSVLLRARLIAGVPADLIGSLTGLTEGRFPVYARARYADDLEERALLKRVGAGENAANLVESSDTRRSIDIYARRGAPVVAVNDGVVKWVGQNDRLGRYVVLQDVYGNRFTYGHLGQVSRVYPVPKDDAFDPDRSAQALKANDATDPRPTAPASAGRQPDDSDRARARYRGATRDRARRASAPVKQRLFAHPSMPGARESGGLEQLLDAEARKAGGFEVYKNYFSRPFGLDPSKVRFRRLKKGSRVIGGTILGRIGQTVPGRAAHVDFSIRPAGRGAPRIDPKPILDGWKLLEATAIYRASGRNVLYGDEAGSLSIGQVLLLPKPLLERRVLSDERIEIYPCGRDDIRSGQIDRRVLATLEYLAESGLEPTVTSLKCGHSYLTSSGNVSHHSSGNAADIAAINGVPIVGHQEPGGVTDQAVRRLMLLQGTMAPAQIISLLDLGGPTLALADHADHIHIGFQPTFGPGKKLGESAFAVLKPGQWSDLVSRLGEIDNPVVPTEPSKYSLPARRDRRASTAHAGE
jgi:outer membrane biosynthesis protein TonB